jgi:dCTP deaminase
MCREKGMIEPFDEGGTRAGVISYGLSSYGYDLRLADDFFLMTADPVSVLDPKAAQGEEKKTNGAPFTLAAHSFVLGRSLEYFRIPRNVIGLCFGKSTYARCGILINVTPLEPEWEGYLTISIGNTAALPVLLYPGEGIAQIVFIESDELCEISYGDRKGKYQKQERITPSKV